MRIVLSVYIICCIMLVLFDVLFVAIKNMRNSYFYPQLNKLQDEIEEKFHAYVPQVGLDVQWKESLREKIKQVRNLSALHNALTEVKDHREELEAEVAPMVFAQIAHYLKRPAEEQAYYAYVISCLDYSRDPVDRDFALQFMELLDSNSLYTFSNAMAAIYQFGDTHLMMMAIDKCDQRGEFYHKKLFVDGLLSYAGDKEILDRQLLDSFDKYQDATKIKLLDYFRMNATKADILCRKILQTREMEDEVLYGAMRYFRRFPDEESKAWFLEALNAEDTFWVKKLLSIQGLSIYRDAQTRQAIKKHVTSRDWYVRNEAVKYLHDTGLHREETRELLELRDTYTNDALVYQYRNDLEMSSYIDDVVRQMKEEEEQAKEAEKVGAAERQPALT